MKVSFVWENELPESESKTRIEKALSFDLDHFPDQRKLKPEQLTLRVVVDKAQTAISGVGYNQEGVPIIISTYSLVTTTGSCRYYDDPSRTE